LLRDILPQRSKNAALNVAAFLKEASKREG
jgi:hypothetical protein